MQDSAAGDSLFEKAPPFGIERRLGLAGSGNRVGRRMLALILAGWAPIVVLTLAQAAILGGVEQIQSLFRAVEIHIRYLIAAPLLVYAEAQCAPLLSIIVRHFADSGVVPLHERARFESTLASTRRLVESSVAEVAVIVLAGLAIAGALWSSLGRVPLWHQSAGITPLFSPSGWWHVLVSMPLLLVLFFGWMWRIALWAHLLWRISRLDLRLEATHPDAAGGLGFLGYSVRAFSTVALAFAVPAAARTVHNVLEGNDILVWNLYFNIGWLVFVALLFTAPLLAFIPPLAYARRRGILQYGALATRMGNVFARNWIGRDAGIDDDALKQQDFSATTDLYQVVSNVQRMRFMPVNLGDIGVLAAAMLLPFIPVMLISIPPEVILAGVKGLLL